MDNGVFGVKNIENHDHSGSKQKSSYKLFLRQITLLKVIGHNKATFGICIWAHLSVSVSNVLGMKTGKKINHKTQMSF